MFKKLYIISLISVLFFSCTNDTEEIIPEPIVSKINSEVPRPVIPEIKDSEPTSKFNANEYRLQRIESIHLGVNISFEYDSDHRVIGGVIEGNNYNITYDNFDRIVKIEVEDRSIYKINYLASHEIHLIRTDSYNYNHVFKYVINDQNQVVKYRYQLVYEGNGIEEKSTFFDMNYYYNEDNNIETSFDNNKNNQFLEHKFDTEIDNPYTRVRDVIRFFMAGGGKHILVETESKNRVSQWYAGDYYIYTETALSLNIKIEKQEYEQQLYFEKI
ncbi:hypothetical protein EI427_22620 [Flammeovirga pectinis]|uniref:DUF4595 domain-containing protein n=1 Tax=Flammeovirga pectinis TaxID=2494373 RepID=A0A3Q9FRY8_9BACT|nr:hypothetical protein [Flammeovirga pectinis]AZQ65017.1 hypothetical protein EI427_22620 [Flammeovirga pectinis]